MRYLCVLIALLFVPVTLLAAAPDDPCTSGWVQGNNTDTWTMQTEQIFTSVAAGATKERSLGVCGAKRIKLTQVIVSSTDCVDCDVFISTTSGTGGVKLLYQKDTNGGDTVNEVVYTLYSAGLIDSEGTTETPTTLGDDRRVYVRVKNNDGGARTVKVTGIWGL